MQRRWAIAAVGSARSIVAKARPSIDASLLAWLLPAAVLVFLVVAPLTRLVIASFQSPDNGSFTLHNYIAAYGQARNVRALLHSLGYGAAVTALAAVFAVPIAWGLVRTDMPGKSLIRAAVLGAFITPSYLGAISWILLAGPNAGWLNRIWMSATGGATGLFNIYSFAGLVFVTALYAFPYIFVYTTAGLELISAEMEEAAHALGGGPLVTAFRITLPLVMPALVGGAVITFLDTIALFGTPVLIALPARFNVASLQLWQFFEFPVRAEVAAAYSLPLIAIPCFLLWIQRLALGRRSYVAVTGKGGGAPLRRFGWFRWVILAYSVAVCALAVLLPFLVLVQAALSKAWGRGFSLANLTLENFHYLFFVQLNARQSIIHSFVYGAITACLAVALAIVIAYVVSRRLLPLGGTLAALSMAPFVIPGIVLGLGFYAVYARPPFALYGTATIMIIAFITRFLPLAYVNCAAGVLALSPDLEDAVRSLGAGRFITIRSIVAPLLKRTLLGSWILVFIPAIRELSTAIFLVGPHTRVISVTLLDLSEAGNFEVLSALGLVLLVVTVAIVSIGYGMLGRNLLLARGT